MSSEKSRKNSNKTNNKQINSKKKNYKHSNKPIVNKQTTNIISSSRKTNKKISKNNSNKKTIKTLFTVVLVLILIMFCLFVYSYYYNLDKETKEKELQKENYYKTINDNYNEYVVTNSEQSLYDKDGNTVGKVSENMYLHLESLPNDNKTEYFKLKNMDMYIKYTNIDKTEQIKQNDRYKNYILFNESIVTNYDTKFYIDENTYYVVNQVQDLPIIIKEDDKYYVEFDNKLVYVKKKECEVKEENNSTEEKATSVAILNYHFVINKEAGEDKLCSPSSICHTDSQFESHVKYIKNNNIFSITMNELEMFIDGKINLPKKAVSITIDDGWFVDRAKQILNNYQVNGTLFLIGYLAPVSSYESEFLEVHSHTWNLHNVSNCSEGRSPLLCYDKNTIVTDLKQSRESLNNTTYFCYPFYEYNNNAIAALKEAGFTMALTGGNTKARIGIDKFKVPRYVIYNNTTVEEIANIINN